MGTTRKSPVARKKARTKEPQSTMPVVLRNVPAGYNWGWFAREDQRMHLQVVDRKHLEYGYKVWLERNGRRVFEPAGEIPAKVLKALEPRVQTGRPSIQAEWVHFMIEQRWLTYSLAGTVLTLVAYPRSPNRFERTIDLKPHIGVTDADKFTEKDVRLNSEFAVIELWPSRPKTRRPFIRIAPILWRD